MMQHGAQRLGAARPVNSDTAQVLIAALRAQGAQRVLDLGCGDGALAATLAQAGFQVLGADPAPAAVEAARRRCPGLTFVQAGAEALPDDLGRFDACCLVNALHHIPPAHMADALLAAVDRVAPDGLVHVVEPLAEGSFFRAMLPVEDETRVRQQAIATLEALLSSRRIVLRDLQRWTRHSRFSGLQGFVDYLVRVDPARADTARANAAALARAWRDNIRVQDGQAVLSQPLVCWTLGAPS